MKYAQTHPKGEFLEEVRDATGVGHFVTGAGVRYNCKKKKHTDGQDQISEAE